MVKCTRMADPRRAVSVYLRERGAARELSPATMKNTRYVLMRFADACPADITKTNRRHVLRWMDEHRNLSDSTMAYHLGIVRSFCRWLVVTRKISRDPTLTIEGPKRPRRRPRAMTYEAIRTLLAATDDARLRVAVSLMLMEGLRLSEVTGVQVGDIDFDRRLLHVYGKGNKHRTVPLTSTTAAAMRVYMAECPPAVVGPLIRSQQDPQRPISPNRLGRLVTDLMRDTGVKERAGDGRSPHALRHTAATDVLAAGASVTQVRDLLGHENVATTQVYLAAGDAEGLRAPMEDRPYARRLNPARENT